MLKQQEQQRKQQEEAQKKAEEEARKKLKKMLRNNKNNNTIPAKIHHTQTEMLLQQSLNIKKSFSLNEKRTSLLSFSLHITFLFQYTTALTEYKNDNYSVSL